MPLFFCAGVRMRFPVACSVLFLHMVLLAVHHSYLLTETTCTPVVVSTMPTSAVGHCGGMYFHMIFPA